LASDQVFDVGRSQIMRRYPPLKSLHAESFLSQAKLVAMEKAATKVLIASLVPGQRDCLKTRPDGTILDGHHRIHVLRKRGIEVDTLPREVLEKASDDET
jgi:hypothetical protein